MFTNLICNFCHKNKNRKDRYNTKVSSFILSFLITSYPGVGVVDVAVRVVNDGFIAAEEVEAETIGSVVEVE